MHTSACISILSIVTSHLVHAANLPQTPLLTQTHAPLTFELRHLHALHPDTHKPVFQDIPSSLYSSPSLSPFLPRHSVRTRPLILPRPASHDDFEAARQSSMYHEQSMAVDWQMEDTLGPDITDLETLVTLAKMTGDAYAKPGGGRWYDIGSGWNNSYDVGWEPDADGFRGHVFATPDNSTVVLSIKGTSLTGRGPTARKDKLNDNLLWSCCCARVDFSWKPVCGCYAGAGKCNQNCLEDALKEKSLFYPVGTNLYMNISYMYPNSEIWLTGHSLGGGLSSLLGVTFGAPAVAFESPGERLASERLHLPSPPFNNHVTHVYHTADPIPLGACTGPLSPCYIGRYALETKCHLGKSIVYDTVRELNWSVSLTTHTIKTVIEKVLDGGWNWTVPEAKAEDDCIDCYSWEFGNFTKKKLY